VALGPPKVHGGQVMGVMKDLQIQEDNDKWEKSRRGKNNRKRGNSIELSVAKTIGGKRVGMFGGKVDVENDHLQFQVKSGSAFPERIWSLLQSIEYRTDRLRGVVHVSAEGSGIKRRALVTFDLEEYLNDKPSR
jgi:hypothetical protein